VRHPPSRDYFFSSISCLFTGPLLSGALSFCSFWSFLLLYSRISVRPSRARLSVLRRVSSKRPLTSVRGVLPPKTVSREESLFQSMMFVLCFPLADLSPSLLHPLFESTIPTCFPLKPAPVFVVTPAPGPSYSLLCFPACWRTSQCGPLSPPLPL